MAADASVVRRAATKKAGKKVATSSSNLASPSRSVSRKEKVNAVSKASLAMLNPAYAMGLELDLGFSEHSADEVDSASRWAAPVSRHAPHPSVPELEVYTMEELAMGKHIVRDDDEEDPDEEESTSALPYASPAPQSVPLPPVSPSAAVPMSAPPTMSVFEASPPDSSPRHGPFRREMDDADAPRGRKAAKGSQSGSSLSRFFTWKRTASSSSSPKTVSRSLQGPVSPPGSAPAYVTTFGDAANWRSGDMSSPSTAVSTMRSPRRVPVPALPPIYEANPKTPSMARQRKSSLPTLREIRSQIPSHFSSVASPTHRASEERSRPSLDAARRERSPARSPRAPGRSIEATSPRSPMRPLDASDGGLAVTRPRMRISTVGRGSRRTTIFDNDHDVFAAGPASPTPLKPVIKLNPVPVSATAKQRAAARAANKPTSTFVVDDEHALAYGDMAEHGLMADRKFRRRSRSLGSAAAPDVGMATQPWAPELSCFPSLVRAAAATASPQLKDSPKMKHVEITVAKPHQPTLLRHQASDSADMAYVAEIATVSARRNVNTVMGRGVVGTASPSLVTRSPRQPGGAFGVASRVAGGPPHTVAQDAQPLSPPVIVNIMPPTPVLGAESADGDAEPASPKQQAAPSPLSQQAVVVAAPQSTVPMTPVTVVKSADRRAGPSMQQLSTAKVVSWQRVSGIGSMDEATQKEMKRFEDELEAHLCADAPLVEFRARRNGSDATDASKESGFTGSSSNSSSDRPFAYESTNGSPGRRETLTSPTRGSHTSYSPSSCAPSRRRPNHQPSPSKSQFSSSSASTNNLRALSSFGSSNSLASDFTASTSILDFGSELAADGFASGLVGKGDGVPSELRSSGPLGPPPSFDVPQLPKAQEQPRQPFKAAEPVEPKSLLPYDEPEDCETPKLSSVPLSTPSMTSSTSTSSLHLASPAASSPFGRSPASSSVMTPPFAYDLSLPEELADLPNDPTISGAALDRKPSSSSASPRSSGASPRRRSPPKSRGRSGSIAIEAGSNVVTARGPHLNLAPGIVAPITPPYTPLRSLERLDESVFSSLTSSEDGLGLGLGLGLDFADPAAKGGATAFDEDILLAPAPGSMPRSTFSTPGLRIVKKAGSSPIPNGAAAAAVVAAPPTQPFEQHRQESEMTSSSSEWGMAL